MNICPKCGSVEGFCEEVDVAKGEVEGYHCVKCGYSSTEE